MLFLLGYFFIDEHVLQEEGIKDMTPYAYDKSK